MTVLRSSRELGHAGSVLRRASVVWATCAVFALASGCESEQAEPWLLIVSPAPNTVFSPADDAASDPGFQTLVVVRSQGVLPDAVIEIFVLDPREPNAPPVGAGSPGAVSEAMIPVTLKPGLFHLQARLRSGALHSPSVAYTAPDLTPPPLPPASCPRVSFVAPQLPAGGTNALQLGAQHDRDGTPCGASFAVDVAATSDAQDGTQAQLMVNGAGGPAGTVSGGRLEFQGVVLSNRGGTPNLLSLNLAATGPGGTLCPAVPFPVPILVDCQGPSCTIIDPVVTQGFLNRSHDDSNKPGFQLDVRVSTDVAGAGQPVHLAVDNGVPLTADAVLQGDNASATFLAVDLAQGPRVLQAQCRDELGNPTASMPLLATVDSVPCGLSVVTPEPNKLFVPGDDVAAAVAGVQVWLQGRVEGDDCSDGRAGECASVDGASFVPLEGQRDLRAQVTLANRREQTLCLEVRDRAGNINRQSVAVELRSDAPQVALVARPEGWRFNALGNTHDAHPYVADLDPSTTVCEAAFEVLCSEVGSPVSLGPVEGGAALATAPCEAEPALSQGFAGQAVFSSVALPLWTSPRLNLVAYQKSLDQQVEGVSEPVAVMHDCQPPAVSLLDTPGMPLCTDLTPAPTGMELRRSVRVSSTEERLRLQVFRAGGANPDTPIFTSTTPIGGGSDEYVFSGVSFQNGGAFVVVVTATDAFGNEAVTESCQVRVSELPSLTVTSPGHDDVLGLGEGCSGSGAFNLPVTATTDAQVGSVVTLGLGDLPATETQVMAGGAISACIPAPQGRVPLTVRVTDDGRAGAVAVHTLHVLVDTLVPPRAIADLALLDPSQTVSLEDDNPRAGAVRFRWTAVPDADLGQVLERYELRCLPSPNRITDEASWTSASVHGLLERPAAAGTVQEATVQGFRIGAPEYCVLRGADPAGQWTPLPVATDPGYNVYVELRFRTQLVLAADSARLGLTMSPVGDVNGDGRGDLLLGGNGSAHLYFGASGASELAPAPDVALTGEPDSLLVGWGAFGESVASLGDFNGDGCPDFAIGEGAGLGFNRGKDMGRVYVFYGRDNDPNGPCPDRWPAQINAVAGCGMAEEVDLCVTSSSNGAFFGLRVTGPGDFDGDGLSDLAVSSVDEPGGDGRVYLLLGRSAYTSGTRLVVPGTPGMPEGNPDGFVLAEGSRHQLGIILGGLGDTNGDAKADLLLGSNPLSASNPMNSKPWGLYTVPGRTYAGSGLKPVPISAWQEHGVGNIGFAPMRAEPAGDVNGDGLLDLSVALVDQGPGSMAPAQVQIWPGDATGHFDRNRALVIQNTSDGSADLLGLSLASATSNAYADLDRDGLADPFMGAAGIMGPPGAGFLFYGDTVMAGAASSSLSPGDASLALQLDHRSQALLATPEDRRNPWRFVQYAGDMNGDGYPDLALADPKSAMGAGTLRLLY